MDRYEFVNEIRSDTGKRMYSTSRYMVINPTPEDTYIYAFDGMRLDNLAFQYYGDAGLWWIIALANNLGKGTFIVPLKQQIRIPSAAIVSELNDELYDAQNDV
jgi:hypothetical protein